MKKNLVKILEEMIDYDCKVIKGDCFMYSRGTITVNPNETYFDNMEWKRFLKERFNFNLNRKNWFVMSVLHELGHHYTLKYFTEEEQVASQKECDNEYDHFYEKVELVATDWAVKFYNLNHMEDWNEIIMENL